jgi:RNA polymerase primary sigma factor
MDTPAQRQDDERQSQLKLLIAKGKEQGYLTYSEVNDHLPSDIVDPEQIEDIVNMINDMGITVYEKAPDAESLLLSDNAVANDEDAADEAAAALATVDAEFGRTTDPVRMYMREMGTVELLTREGEIRIAKRIEEGLDQVRSALVQFPQTCQLIFDTYEQISRGETRLQDLITGFIDPNEQIADPTARAAEQVAEEADPDDEETVVDTGPDPEEVAARVKKVKRLHKRGREITLLPENPDFAPIAIEARRDALTIEGIGVGVIRSSKSFMNA